MTESTERKIMFLREENAELRRSVEELSVLNELAATIGGVTALDNLLDLILERATAAVGAEQGAIFLVTEETEEPAQMHTLIRSGPEPSNQPSFRLSDAIFGWMQIYHKPIIVNSPATDERFAVGTESELPRSVLAVPMLIRSRLVATLVLFNSNAEEGFSAENRRLLSIIAMQSAQVLENARLHTQELELLRVQQEIELASRIQRTLLPSIIPDLGEYEIAGRTEQHHAVGGDFYDMITCDSEQSSGTIFCLGDVCGKGLPASLLMSTVLAIVRTQTLFTTSPTDILERANRMLHASTDDDQFVTLMMVHLDRTSGELTCANAGHDQPVVLRIDGEPETINERGAMLGIVAEHRVPERRLRLAPGEMLLLYSDGFSEGIDRDGKEFGVDRLVGLVNKLRIHPLDAIIERVFAHIEENLDSSREQDDRTLLLLRRKPTR